jgi:hypothetical protein
MQKKQKLIIDRIQVKLNRNKFNSVETKLKLDIYWLDRIQIYFVNPHFNMAVCNLS